MPRALFCAEKPSFMIEAQKAYNKIKDKLPYDIDFTCAAGHLIGLCEPDEYGQEWGQPWQKEVLPMVPEQWLTKVINSKFYKNIKDMWESNSYDVVINAGDPGREGQLIQHLIYNELNVNVPILRFWCEDTTEKGLSKAFLNMKPDEEYKGLTDASYLRLYFDWLVGMNFSRATTLSLGRTVRVGRVMTAVLSMIVNRELEIKNFKPKDYYVLEGTFNSSNGVSYKGTLINPNPTDDLPTPYAFFDKALIENIKNSLSSTGIIEEVSQKDNISYAPTLYNLSDLQKFCSSQYGYDPAQTLALAQELYEQGFLSYPRTDSKHITTEQAKEVKGLFSSLSSIGEFTKLIDAIMNNQPIYEKILTSKRYVNNSKVSDHPALLPTEKVPDVYALPERQRNVYMAVVKRFLSIFMPPHVTTTLTIITRLGDNESLKFRTTETKLKQIGWKMLYPNKSEKKEDNGPSPLLTLTKDMTVVSPSTDILDKQTSAPNRYNSSTILDAMETAGRQLTDEELEKVLMECAGLGTPATRAEILTKLYDYKYITKKSTTIYPTQEGLELVEALKGHNITSPELTAQWEKRLKEVENGVITYDKFYSVMLMYIKNETSALLGLTYIGPFSELLGKCPICKDDFLSFSQFYACNSYFTKDEQGNRKCGFALPKVFGKKDLTLSDVKELIAGRTTKKKKFIWKDGKTSESSLTLIDGKLAFAKEEKKVYGSCPLCGNDVYKGKGFYCKMAATKDEQGNRKCSFSVYPAIGKTNITDAVVSQVIKNGISDKEVKVTWNSGKSISGKVIFDDQYRLTIKPFEAVELCPCNKCVGGTVMEEKFYYKCNHLPPTGSCELQIPKTYYGTPLTRQDAMDLMNGKSITKSIAYNGKSSKKKLTLVRDPEKGYIIKWEFDNSNNKKTYNSKNNPYKNK